MRKTGLLFKLAMCLILCVAGLCIAASAASYSLAGNTLTLYDLTQETDTVIAAGYDSQGRMLFAETAVVAKNSSGIREGTVTLPDQKAVTLKTFFVSSSYAPTEEPQPVEQELATRVWMCRKLCDFWDVDLSLYDGTDIPFDDCKALTAEEQQAIFAAWDMDIMMGYPDGNFHPDWTFTRAEAAKVLCIAVGRMPPLEEDILCGYADVSVDHWASPFIKELRDLNVLPKTENFHPSATVGEKDFSDWLKALAQVRDALRGGASVSNIRFTMQNGLPVLAWDSNETDRVNYQVFLQSADGNWREIGNSNVKEEFPVIAGPGNWRGVRVEARDAQTRTSLGEAENPFLSICVTDRGSSSVQPIIQIADQGDQWFAVTVNGMTGFSTYNIGFRSPANPNDGRGCFWSLTDGESGYRRLNGDPSVFLPPNGECRLIGGANYSLRGNTLTYDFYTLRPWSSAPFSAPAIGGGGGGHATP